MKGGDDIEIDRFYSIHSLRALQQDSKLLASDLVSITRSFRSDLGLPQQYLPIALIREKHDILLLAVSGKREGVSAEYDFLSLRKSARLFGRFPLAWSALRKWMCGDSCTSSGGSG